MLLCCNFSGFEAHLRISIPQHAADYFGLTANPCPDGISLTVAPFDYIVITV